MTPWLLVGSGFALGVMFVVLAAIAMILIVAVCLGTMEGKATAAPAAPAPSAPTPTPSWPSTAKPQEHARPDLSRPSSWGGARPFPRGLD